MHYLYRMRMRRKLHVISLSWLQDWAQLHCRAALVLRLSTDLSPTYAGRKELHFLFNRAIFKLRWSGRKAQLQPAMELNGLSDSIGEHSRPAKRFKIDSGQPIGPPASTASQPRQKEHKSLEPCYSCAHQILTALEDVLLRGLS